MYYLPPLRIKTYLYCDLKVLKYNYKKNVLFLLNWNSSCFCSKSEQFALGEQNRFAFITPLALYITSPETKLRR